MDGIAESEVLLVGCPTCKAIENNGCLDRNRHVFTRTVGAVKLAFHAQRIQAALDHKFRNMVGSLGATEKALILHYAFIMLCDACSVKSEQLVGTKHTTHELQLFFARQAVEALQKDGLLTPYVKPS